LYKTNAKFYNRLKINVFSFARQKKQTRRFIRISMTKQIQSEEALFALLKDHQLTTKEGITSFTARVQLYINNFRQFFDSEIQVVSSDGLTSVHVLDLDNKDRPLPDVFDPKKEHFIYKPSQGLSIFGQQGDTKFQVDIVPKP
jgi:hypothetical protein